MELTPVQFYSAIGAIVAALISGFLSLLSLVTSKDQKLSELRDQWISDFRKELSELIAEIRYALFWVECFHLDPANIEKNPLLETKYQDAYLKFSKAFTALKLRTNSYESTRADRALNAAFNAKLDQIAEKFRELNSESAEALTEELRRAAAPLLKSKWKQIEKGNGEHRFLKWGAIIILLAGLSGVLAIAKPVLVHHDQQHPGNVEEGNNAANSAAAPPRSNP